ncbi:MAG: hypothetical protein QMD61_06540 [Methanobacterium sp.]|nr:hypothetical protein [Methanobacterium sp.]
MTKFDKLCESFANARKRYFNYENECLEFGAKMVDGLVEYLECPPEQVNYYPPDKESDPNVKYNIKGATKLGEDGFWHIGIGVGLYEAPHIRPQENVRSTLLIKKDDSHFIVKYGREASDEFRVGEDNEEDLKQFYRHIYHEIKELYDKELENIKGGAEFAHDHDDLRYIQ